MGMHVRGPSELLQPEFALPFKMAHKSPFPSCICRDAGQTQASRGRGKRAQGSGVHRRRPTKAVVRKPGRMATAWEGVRMVSVQIWWAKHALDLDGLPALKRLLN
eukprot:scaffold77809_cov17-Tisochrysis_lutea.AAC.3